MYRFRIPSKPLYLLLFIVILSCKNEPKNPSRTNDNYDSNGQEEASKAVKLYTRDADCETFFQSIDFSPLCFTSEKTPKIQETPSNSGNDCQYKILLEDYGTEVYVLVNYNDYENSIYNDPEKAKYIHEQSFRKKRSNQYLFTTTTDVDIEDEAYFGVHDEHKQRSLHIRMDNVVIAIQVEGAQKTNPCLLSNQELTKFANLIIERVKR